VKQNPELQWPKELYGDIATTQGTQIAVYRSE
jgi:hypothetical protein